MQFFSLNYKAYLESFLVFLQVWMLIKAAWFEVFIDIKAFVQVEICVADL